MIVYHVNMLTFYKIFQSVRNLKIKSKPSSPLLNPSSKHTLSLEWGGLVKIVDQFNSQVNSVFLTSCQNYTWYSNSFNFIQCQLETIILSFITFSKLLLTSFLYHAFHFLPNHMVNALNYTTRKSMICYRHCARNYNGSKYLNN